MPTWLLSKNTWIAIGVVVILSLSTYWAHNIFHAGSEHAIAVQATDQIKHNEKIKSKYAKIDKDTPNGNDKSAAIDWLYKHTTSSK
jgi:hypothetical protein